MCRFGPKHPEPPQSDASIAQVDLQICGDSTLVIHDKNKKVDGRGVPAGPGVERPQPVEHRVER